MSTCVVEASKVLVVHVKREETEESLTFSDISKQHSGKKQTKYNPHFGRFLVIVLLDTISSSNFLHIYNLTKRKKQ